MQRRAKVIGGYQIIRELGRGGMGVVYLAHDPRLGREVAVKLMTEVDAETSSRFQTEAEALARLSHPGIVAIHSAGVEGGLPYLVMDRVEGGSLKDRLERQGPLEFADAAGLVRDMARALEHAHRHGILHRDIKPENVLLTPDDRPRVTDFGIARDEHAEKERLTRTGQILGTLGYMPPEQANGELDRIDRRGDVYSLGATLYALLTGRAPFVGKSVLNVLNALLTADPEPPAKLRAGLPRDLEAVCLRCLAKNPEGNRSGGLAAHRRSAEAKSDFTISLNAKTPSESTHWRWSLTCSRVDRVRPPQRRARSWPT